MKIFVIDRKSKEYVEIKKIDVDTLAKVVDSVNELFHKKAKFIGAVKESSEKSKKPRRKKKVKK